jgi:hypothetical protein
MQMYELRAWGMTYEYENYKYLKILTIHIKIKIL